MNIGSLNLNVAADGSGTPLVLLHGFPQTHLAWRDVAVELAQDHLVICPDLRGYGASDKPSAEPGGETDLAVVGTGPSHTRAARPLPT